MRFKIFFFAELRVKMGTEFIEENFDDVGNVHELQKRLEEKYETLRGCFLEGKVIKIAVNHEYCGLNTALRDGDEVAFFPPVTGG